MYGANSKDWLAFKRFANDLLPVVSDPAAKISPNSTLGSLGKVPSVYNSRGLVAGLTDWTSKQTTAAELAAWQRVPNYGICVQTRELRAVDIDVDSDLADEIAKEVGDFPVRWRTGSKKILMAFIVKGEFPKRTVRVDGGIVEFLANGQQFVACGTHVSGARYEWTGVDFPEITADAYAAIIRRVEERFGLSSAEGALRRPKIAGEVIREDAVSKLLTAEGKVRGRGKDGAIFIDCPFKNNHTSDSGPSATAYMPPGRGYQRGHFKCMHAHCAGRTDDEFENALGIKAAVFTSLTSIEDDLTPEQERPLPPFQRDKLGRIEPTAGNIYMALRNEWFTGYKLAFDEFKGEDIISPAGKVEWRPINNEDCSMLILKIEGRGFKPVSKEAVRDYISYVCGENALDSAQTWLGGLVWDGVPRVETFAETYLRAGAGAYQRAFGAYLWTALAGRVLAPGVKADMVPILEGAQGIGKTRVVTALAPAQDFVCEMSFAEKDADLVRKLRGKLVIEISELQGLKSRDLDYIKAFVTRTKEDWVPKFKEKAESYLRRGVFIGTTNEGELFSDPTGNRRWLPLHINDNLDVGKLIADRDQLWAEGAVLFKENGVMWEAVAAEAEAVREGYFESDSWEAAISDWISAQGLEPRGEGIKGRDVLKQALGLADKDISRAHTNRLGRAMRRLGYVNSLVRVNGDVMRVYVKSSLR
jgi:hypothetical protein